jgi:hypothetical protein
MSEDEQQPRRYHLFCEECDQKLTDGLTTQAPTLAQRHAEQTGHREMTMVAEIESPISVCRDAPDRQ